VLEDDSVRQRPRCNNQDSDGGSVSIHKSPKYIDVSLINDENVHTAKFPVPQALKDTELSDSTDHESSDFVSF